MLNTDTRGCVPNNNFSLQLQDTPYRTETCLCLSLKWHQLVFRFSGVHNPCGLCGTVLVITCVTLAADSGASARTTLGERPQPTTAHFSNDTSSPYPDALLGLVCTMRTTSTECNNQTLHDSSATESRSLTSCVLQIAVHSFVVVQNNQSNLNFMGHIHMLLS